MDSRCSCHPAPIPARRDDPGWARFARRVPSFLTRSLSWHRPQGVPSGPRGEERGVEGTVVKWIILMALRRLLCHRRNRALTPFVPRHLRSVPLTAWAVGEGREWGRMMWEPALTGLFAGSSVTSSGPHSIPFPPLATLTASGPLRGPSGRNGMEWENDRRDKEAVEWKRPWRSGAAHKGS